MASCQTPAEKRRHREAIDRAVQYWVERPYLEPPEDMEPFLADLTDAQKQTLEQASQRLPADPETRWQQQLELERLWENVMAAELDRPLDRWGFSPDRVSPVTLLTHIFLHVRWLHLFGNMLFLFPVGTLLEDRWGRVAFGGFYVLAGLVSTLIDALLFAQEDSVYVGASGAVSGVMGAFAVRFWNVRLRILASFLVLCKTFWIPAWTILWFWFAQELLSAPAEIIGESHVAHLAHVAGFLFGALFALGFRWMRAEERWLEPAIRSKIEREVLRDDGLDRALALAGIGCSERAWALLSARLDRTPADVEAALALWSLAADLGRSRQAAPAMARAIAEELRRGDRDLAVEHWRQLRSLVPDAILDPASLVALAGALAARHRRDEAADALRRLLETKDPAPNPATLLRASLIAESFDPGLARAAASRALRSRGLDPADEERARRLLARASRVSVRVARVS